MAHLLHPPEIRARNKCNVISFLGQFWGFVTELTFLAVLLFTLTAGGDNTDLKGVIFIIKFMEFGVLSLVEVLTSDGLTNSMLEDFNMIISVFTNCFNC